MKRINLVSVGVGWAILGGILKAESMQTHLAQSPILPDIPPPTASPTSPPLVEPLPLPQVPTIPLAPLNQYLFDPLGGQWTTAATNESLAGADQALQSIWEQAKILAEDSPQFANQVGTLLQSLALIQSQYQGNQDPWGELKTLEISLKLHYLMCQDRQTLEVAQDGLAIATDTNNSNIKKQWSTLLTEIYWAMGETDLALKNQQQMLESFRNSEGELTFFEAYDLMNLGDLYKQVEQDEQAIAAYVEAVESAHRPPPNRDLDVYYAAGYAFKQAAIEKLIEFYELRNPTQFEYWVQQREQANQAYEQFAKASDLLWGSFSEEPSENIPPAQRKLMIEEALQIFRQIGDRWGELDALVFLSAVNLTLQDYSQAISTGETALELAITLGDPRTQESVVDTLIQAYLAMGQENQAEMLQKSYHQSATRQSFSEVSRPRFIYKFANAASYEMLPILHQQRRCLGES